MYAPTLSAWRTSARRLLRVQVHVKPRHDDVVGGRDHGYQADAAIRPLCHLLARDAQDYCSWGDRVRRVTPGAVGGRAMGCGGRASGWRVPTPRVHSAFSTPTQSSHVYPLSGKAIDKKEIDQEPEFPSHKTTKSLHAMTVWCLDVDSMVRASVLMVDPSVRQLGGKLIHFIQIDGGSQFAAARRVLRWE